MKRDAFLDAFHRTLPLDLGHELIIDNFAGGGGTSEGLEQGFGRPVDIAINHDPEALAMHALNHPHTLHLCESVWDVKPLEVTRNRPVALVWLSPDCKHFSRAKGGTPVDRNIRGLAWIGLRWVALTKPRVLALENVEPFTSWGPVIVGPDGKSYPDPRRKGVTFQSFVRQLRAHGYNVDWRELRACDQGAPTIRKRLFLVARRDGLPIVWPEATHAEPTSRAVLAGKLLPYRTAAECIDFGIAARSVFDRPKPLAVNTMRRVAKGLWRHVLTSASPYIVEAANDSQAVLTPFLSEHANGSTQRNMPADEPMRTICSEVKGGHFSVVTPRLAPVITTNTTGHSGAGMNSPLPTITTGGHHAVTAAALAPLRGTSRSHTSTHDLAAPLSTVSAGGTHHALLSANLATIGYGERKGQEARTQEIDKPVGTVVAGGVKQAVVAAHLADMGHGESCATGARPWSNGVRCLEEPLNTVTAREAARGLSAAYMTKFRAGSVGHSLREPMHTVTANSFVKRPGGSVPMGVVAACLEQANGGFYEGDGRSVDVPLSTVLSKGANQRLISAYCVRVPGVAPTATVQTKRRGKRLEADVTMVTVPAAAFAPEQLARAKQCADLLHQYLPEQFPVPVDLIIAGEYVLLDITLRMLKPRELFRAQSFPEHYVIEEIPDPAILFKDGVQAADPLSVPRIPLTATAQVRMCGNSVAPVMSAALVRSNFAHERLIYGRMAA
ncbi:DNA cytosine methyltransferase [Ramlibacter sp. AN1133]|uniref:DNA cytosine methyltransferase n=1 Tax=Ramlibacter sp. AN1133 TaxID=3133429 RepID=UPI0030BB0E98